MTCKLNTGVNLLSYKYQRITLLGSTHLTCSNLK
jgi:hypothetical protein